MVDSINIRAQLSQVENVQKVQHLRHTEADIEQRQATGQMVSKTEQDKHQVVSSHKTEEDKIHEKQEGEGGQQQLPGQEQERQPNKEGGETNVSSGDDDGHHIDVEV